MDSQILSLRILIPVAIAALLASGSVRAENDQAPLRVHFINVERGDATLFEYPCGTILFDAGGDRGKAKMLTDYLDSYFERRPDLSRRIDLLVLSHAHPDHTRYGDEIIARYEIGKLLTNGHLEEGSFAKMDIGELLEKHPEIDHRKVDTETIPARGVSLPMGADLACAGGPYSDLRLLWGDSRPKPAGWSKKQYQRENNHSVALLAFWGKTRVLMTGDMERPSLLAMLELNGAILAGVDLYQISHHGFPSGSAAKFDEHIRPRIAILSRPADRAWRAKTLDRFNAVVREKRKSVRVPVWVYEGSDDPIDALDDSMLDEVDLGKGREEVDHGKTRVPGSATLSSAVYWTGMDGTIVVEVNPGGELSVSVEKK